MMVDRPRPDQVEDVVLFLRQEAAQFDRWAMMDKSNKRRNSARENGRKCDALTAVAAYLEGGA
jgi:hypothetical protein